MEIRTLRKQLSQASQKKSSSSNTASQNSSLASLASSLAPNNSIVVPSSGNKEEWSQQLSCYYLSVLQATELAPPLLWFFYTSHIIFVFVFMNTPLVSSASGAFIHVLVSQCLCWELEMVVSIMRAQLTIAILCMRSCSTDGGKRWFSSILVTPSPNIFSSESLLWFNIYPGTSFNILLKHKKINKLIAGVWSGRGAKVFHSHRIL